jgi:hypothetical protein
MEEAKMVTGEERGEEAVGAEPFAGRNSNRRRDC